MKTGDETSDDRLEEISELSRLGAIRGLTQLGETGEDAGVVFIRAEKGDRGETACR